MAYEDSQEVWEEQTAEKVLRLTRDELITELPFLSGALSELVYQTDRRLTTSATDGEKLYFQPEQQLRLFEDNPKYLSRLYLHSIFHCLFSHLWLRGDRNEALWGVACDIAVEHTIDRMEKGALKRALSLIRQQVYRDFEETDRPMAAAGIYRYLRELPTERVEAIAREFFADDHVFWPQEKKLSEQQLLLQKKWQDKGRQAERRKKQQGDDPDEGAQSMSLQLRAAKSGRTYRHFLQDFMVMREELSIDPDEFDLGLYSYGLRIYKNMPLIEPLESKEDNRVRDFVVAVDTSYSTSGEPVRKFLRETFQLLTEQNNFFRSSKIHLIQADEKVQSDTVITSLEQIENLFDDFELKGGGNTDFRPVFQYVNNLLEEGEFSQLCGLLYFTDGRGIYPQKQPKYKTAFLYVEPYETDAVPPWAIHYMLPEAT
ncbi:MAG: VWA-like domain-containing protein [Eubacterium sp.]|nr:VWA-like domain-containing protein [Eubacterium sp.]